MSDPARYQVWLSRGNNQHIPGSYEASALSAPDLTRAQAEEMVGRLYDLQVVFGNVLGGFEFSFEIREVA